MMVLALIRRASPATFSRKREKGFDPAPPPPHPELVEGCGRGLG